MNILREKINPFVKDIESSLENKNYYAALSLSLTIPDICCSLENHGRSNREKYIAWISEYFLSIHNYDSHLESGDIYALRCAYLHNGSDNIEEQRAREIVNQFRFFFSYHGNVFHRISSTYDNHRVLLLDVKVFCNEMIQSVEKFILKNNQNEDVLQHTSKMVTLLNDRDGFSI